MIKEGHEFEVHGATVTVQEIDELSVKLCISNGFGNGAWFAPTGIKQLRKFLKKLQRQLEQTDLDSLD